MQNAKKKGKTIAKQRKMLKFAGTRGLLPLLPPGRGGLGVKFLCSFEKFEGRTERFDQLEN